jgi:hypothetical protein
MQRTSSGDVRLANDLLLGLTSSNRTPADTIILGLCTMGLDMVGKLHKSWPGGHVYMLVAVNKFTKWVEAALVTTQDSTTAINFIKSIIFRFGVPHSIITDNGTNFTSKELKNYCESMGIKLKFASIAHPKTNGQVKKSKWVNMQ